MRFIKTQRYILFTIYAKITAFFYCNIKNMCILLQYHQNKKQLCVNKKALDSLFPCACSFPVGFRAAFLAVAYKSRIVFV